MHTHVHSPPPPHTRTHTHIHLNTYMHIHSRPPVSKLGTGCSPPQSWIWTMGPSSLVPMMGCCVRALCVKLAYRALLSPAPCCDPCLPQSASLGCVLFCNACAPSRNCAPPPTHTPCVARIADSFDALTGALNPFVYSGAKIRSSPALVPQAGGAPPIVVFGSMDNVSALYLWVWMGPQLGALGEVSESLAWAVDWLLGVTERGRGCGMGDFR